MRLWGWSAANNNNNKADECTCYWLSRRHLFETKRNEMEWNEQKLIVAAIKIKIVAGPSLHACCWRVHWPPDGRPMAAHWPAIGASIARPTAGHNEESISADGRPASKHIEYCWPVWSFGRLFWPFALEFYVDKLAPPSS